VYKGDAKTRKEAGDFNVSHPESSGTYEGGGAPAEEQYHHEEAAPAEEHCKGFLFFLGFGFAHCVLCVDEEEAAPAEEQYCEWLFVLLVCAHLFFRRRRGAVLESASSCNKREGMKGPKCCAKVTFGEIKRGLLFFGRPP
jgi:hypothetical protein